MTGGDQPSIPLDAHPDPVVEYAAASGELRVTATNAAFDAAFDGATPDEVGAVFDRFAVVESTGAAGAETHVARGDDVDIYLGGADGEAYLVRVASSGDAGYLVFTDVGDRVDDRGGVGVGDVASVLSHDLRNPLDVAKAHLTAARETGDPEHFDAVEDAHERISQIIRDVLTLARGEAAVDPSEPVSVADAVADAWQSVETCRATLRTSGDLPETTGDPDRVRRLLENLFRNCVEHGSTSSGSRTRQNAVEHGSTGNQADAPSDDESDRADHDGQPGAVTVTVGALDGDGEAGGDAGFYVADDGPGVPPEHRDAVFEPGYTTTDDGTGLGLAIVDRIADAHGWTVDLTDAADGGARFEVRFSE